MLNFIDGAQTPNIFVQDNSPTDETSYRARFYFDPNSITMNSAGHPLLIGYTESTPLKWVFWVTFGKASGSSDYQIRVYVYKDDGNKLASSSYTITDEPHALEIWWKASTGAGQNNGQLQLWLDGTLTYSQTAVDNDTHQVDLVKFGSVNTPDEETIGSYCLDHFESRRTTYIGLASGVMGCASAPLTALDGVQSQPETPAGNRLPETEQPETLLFADDFASGDFSAWTSYSNDADLMVNTSAALSGTYGLAVVVDDYRPVVVQDDTPNGATAYQVRFYLDPNGLSLNGGNHTLFRATMGLNQSVLLLDLGHQPGASAYQLTLTTKLENTSWLDSPAFTLTDGPHALEIGWGAASATGAADGWVQLWLDGVLVYEHTQLANAGLQIDTVRLGAVYAPLPGASGMYCLDAFASAISGYIGTLENVHGCGEGGLGTPDGPLPMPSPRKWPLD